MNDLDLIIKKVNNFTDKHPFEFDLLGFTTGKAKIKITGVKNYIRVGKDTPHLQYTIEIMPTNGSLYR